MMSPAEIDVALRNIRAAPELRLRGGRWHARLGGRWVRIGRVRWVLGHDPALGEVLRGREIPLDWTLLPDPEPDGPERLPDAAALEVALEAAEDQALAGVRGLANQLRAIAR